MMTITWMILDWVSLLMSTGSKVSQIEIISADWPAAENIHALSTTRNLHQGVGVSEGAYACLNLAQHVEDEPAHVKENRQLLRQRLKLPEEPLWLDQVHGNNIVDVSSHLTTSADASFSFEKNRVCAVMTADCLPVLICNRQGNKVAAVHAGWRGLADGVIEASIKSLKEKPENLLVWLGPAIGPRAFEVGEEVRQVFIDDLALCESAFKQNRPGHYLADIYQLARLRLKRMGIEAVYGGEYCTCTDTDHFYSFRRDGTTGRQASLIWFGEHSS